VSYPPSAACRPRPSPPDAIVGAIMKAPKGQTGVERVRELIIERVVA
jgi:hypothetical protein